MIVRQAAALLGDLPIALPGCLGDIAGVPDGQIGRRHAYAAFAAMPARFVRACGKPGGARRDVETTGFARRAGEGVAAGVAWP